MFLDEYLPEKIRGYPFVSSPRWSTTITSVDNGDEHRNQNWIHPLHRFTAPEAVCCMEDLEAVKEVWMTTAGPLDSFPLRDPLDFASRRLSAPNTVPTVVRTDQFLGIGDGVTTEFQLMKAYTFGGKTYERLIYLPVVSSVLVGINGFEPSAGPGGPYTVTVERRGGIVRFDPAPQLDVYLTAGFLFDCEARFESDEAFDGITRSYGIAGFADLTFIEIRPCED